MADHIVRIIIKGEDQASDALGTVNKAMGGLGKVALGMGAIGATAMVGIGAGAIKLAIDAAPLADITTSFESMALAAGSSADDVLAAFKLQSDGMVTNAAAMEAYNQATMLVSADFAETLPEAMSYLGKVSAATGVDMDFLLSSLTTGVGRLSPMILDNLSIQVDLVAAYEDWSAASGVAVADMTKEQQQAALTAQVMQLLKENTAAMPDVLGTNTQRMAEMTATMTDMKDSVALALQPALQALLIPLGELATEYGPAVTEWLGVAAEWLGEKVPIAIETVSAFFTNTLIPTFDTVVGFIRDNAVPILAGLGAVLLVTVVPAFIAWASAAIASAAATVIALAPVLIPIALIGATVALLAAAWESDWGGIRTFLTGVWEDHLEPIFESLKEWFEKTIPVAIEFLADLWENILKPALEIVWMFLEATLFPLFNLLVDFFDIIFTASVVALAVLWENVLKPAFEIVWDFLETTLFPLFKAIVEFWNVAFTLALTALSGLWQNVLKPAFEVVWAFIEDYLQPVFDDLKEILAVGLVAAIAIVQPILTGLKNAFDSIKNAIQPVIDFINKMKDALANVTLPDWLTPGSPTPFELGLLGIGAAIKKLPDLSFPVSVGGAFSQAMPIGGAARGGQMGASIVIHNYFGEGSIRSERDPILIANRIEKSFRLRGVRTL